MSYLRGTIACAAALAIGGCSVPIGLFLAKHEVVEYADHGVAFSHRDDWTVTAETETTMGVELTMITIDGPDSALVVVQQFRPSMSIDVDELLASFTTDMRTTAEQQVGGLVDYTQAATQPATRTILGSARNGKESHFSLSLLGETLPHTVQLFPIPLEDRTVVVFMQVADEDLADTTEGFDTILDSLATK